MRASERAHISEPIYINNICVNHSTDNGPIIGDGIGDRVKVAPVSGKYQIGISATGGAAAFEIPLRHFCTYAGFPLPRLISDVVLWRYLIEKMLSKIKKLIRHILVQIWVM